MALVRRADAAHAAALAELHVAVWDDAYTGLVPQRILDERRARPVAERVAAWDERLRDGLAQTWVAEDASWLLGFASSGPGRSSDLGSMLELMAR